MRNFNKYHLLPGLFSFFLMMVGFGLSVFSSTLKSESLTFKLFGEVFYFSNIFITISIIVVIVGANYWLKWIDALKFVVSKIKDVGITKKGRG